MGAAVSAGSATTAALLMGRVLYNEGAGHWPKHADEPFGDVMNSIKKHVVSSSLQAAEGQNSAVMNGDGAGGLAGIKAQEGADITVCGSPATTRRLMRAG